MDVEFHETKQSLDARTIRAAVALVDLSGMQVSQNEEAAALDDCAVPVGEDRYRDLVRTGHGVYSIVYKCRDAVSNKSCAIKILDEENEETDIANEIKALELCADHPNVIALRDKYTTNRGQTCLVFDWAEYNLQGVYFPTPAEFRLCVGQLMAGLAHIHSKGVMHCDVKPQNLLVQNGVLKIADLGIAHFLDSGKRSAELVKEIVTRWYRAPELIVDGTVATPAVDVWAAGCVIAGLVTGLPMFMSRDETHHLSLICIALGAPDEKQWPGLTSLRHYGKFAEVFETAKARPQIVQPALGNPFMFVDPQLADLLRRMFVYDPAARITAAEALKHPYLRGP